MTYRPTLTQMRKRHENRQANLQYVEALRKAKIRATQKTERHNMHQILFQQISPQLRAMALRRKIELDRVLNAR